MSSYDVSSAAVKPATASVAIPLRRSLSTRWISLLTLFALLAIWWAVTATGLIEPLFLPPPSAVLQKGWLLATTGYMDSTLWQHLGASLSRIGLGLGFAILTAVPVGIAIGANRIARGVLDPLIEFYRPIPPLAYLPLIVIWCGIGELSKVLLIYLAIFAPIAIATATGVRTVDPAKLRAAQSLGATRVQLIRHVILPSALPDILDRRAHWSGGWLVDAGRGRTDRRHQRFGLHGAVGRAVPGHRCGGAGDSGHRPDRLRHGNGPARPAAQTGAVARPGPLIFQH